MTIKGKITISRVTSNTEGSYVEVRFQDDGASIEFAIAKLTMEQFAQAITGRGYVDCEIEVRGLDLVGKKMEHATIEFPIPKADYKHRKESATKAAAAYIPEGWVLSDSFSSQGSFFTRDGQEFARATIRRWICA